MDYSYNMRSMIGGQVVDDAMLLARDSNEIGDNVIDDWAHPQRKEQRQLGYQLSMMSAEPSIRMKAMIAAGINPLTAAGGVAGSSPSSIPQPASSVNPLGDVAGAVGSAAAGVNSIAGAVSSIGKLAPEIGNIKSDTAKNFADIGLTNAQTQGVLTDNKYKDEDWKSSLNIKRQQFDNMKAEWSNIVATHNEIMKHINEMQSQIELNGSQQDYFSAMKSRIEEETRFIQAKNQFCLDNKLYLLDSGLDGYIFSMVESGADISQFDKFIEIYSKYRESVAYSSSKGAFDAEIDTAYERAFNEAKGKAEVDSSYAPYLAKVDLLKSVLQEFASACMSNNVSSVREALGKIFNLMFQISGLNALGLDTTNPAGSLPSSPPAAGNVNRSQKFK